MDLSFHHICIETHCYKESIDFYTKVMNFNILHESKDFHGRDYNTWLQNGSIIIELQTPKKDTNREICKGNIGIMHICFRVDNLIETIAEIENKGFSNFINGKRTYKVLNSLLCKLETPEGSIIELRE